jgi:hypothetical protein
MATRPRSVRTAVVAARRAKRPLTRSPRRSRTSRSVACAISAWIRSVMFQRRRRAAKTDEEGKTKTGQEAQSEGKHSLFLIRLLEWLGCTLHTQDYCVVVQGTPKISRRSVVVAARREMETKRPAKAATSRRRSARTRRCVCRVQLTVFFIVRSLLLGSSSIGQEGRRR